MNRFEEIKVKIAEFISHSKASTDPGHSLNTQEWLLKLRPDADEILQIAALIHDIERATPDRLIQTAFESYDAYKVAHASRGAEIAKQMVKETGYSDKEAERIFYLVKHHETGNGDSDVDLVMDADSISYFDFNIEEYLNYYGEEATRKKILFMRERASEKAKKIIDEIIRSKPELNKLSVNQS